MVKEPRMGAVKTRLAREIGPVAATNFYRTTSINLIRRLGHNPCWTLILAATPDLTDHARLWPAAQLAPQGRGGLGERMERLLLGSRAARTVLIGSDIPSVGAHHIAEAFAALGRSDAVFGPAEDGGFWLAGVKRHPPLVGLFDRVRWSGPHALADTLDNLRGRTIALAARLSDVDDAASYAKVADHGRRVTPPLKNRA
jgi:rSAM/selenodomain-associated transferase 1